MTLFSLKIVCKRVLFFLRLSYLIYCISKSIERTVLILIYRKYHYDSTLVFKRRWLLLSFQIAVRKCGEDGRRGSREGTYTTGTSTWTPRLTFLCPRGEVLYFSICLVCVYSIKTPHITAVVIYRECFWYRPFSNLLFQRCTCMLATIFTL